MSGVDSAATSVETTSKNKNKNKNKNKKIQVIDAAANFPESPYFSSSSSTAIMPPSTPRTTAREQKSNTPSKKHKKIKELVHRCRSPPGSRKPHP